MTATRELPACFGSLGRWRPTAAVIALVSFAGFGFWCLTVPAAGAVAEERFSEARFELKFTQTCRRRSCLSSRSFACQFGSATSRLSGVLWSGNACGQALSPHFPPHFLGAGITCLC
jgi:hypothetical protein